MTAISRFREAGNYRELVEETPIAFVCDGTTLAVMLATPTDILDFVVGFSHTEGYSTAGLKSDQIAVKQHATGIECTIDLNPRELEEMRPRLRALTGGSSCGLCGIRSIAQALPIPPTVAGDNLRLDRITVTESVEKLRLLQPLHDRTHAAHAAGFLVPGQGFVCVREDIGRHNALDKLVGALVRDNVDPASSAVVLTSRVSVEIVQKTAALGVPVLLAVSAPSTLGVRTARLAGITLITDIKRGSQTIRTHGYRVHDSEEPIQCESSTGITSRQLSIR